MEFEKLEKLFVGDEIEITEAKFSDIVSESHVESILNTLQNKFKNKVNKLYFIKRLGKGLVQPIATLELIDKNSKEKEYFAVRYFERNEKQYRKRKYFDRALYHKKRMINLKKLKHHYPKILVLNLADGVLILQEFLFSPVCTFADLKSWEELFEIMFLASQNKIFLDYNLNHWLYDEQNGKLYYVDKDYNEDLETISNATKQNFNQSSIFINETNPLFIAQVIQSYLQMDSKKHQNFGLIVKNIIEEKINILETRDQTEVIAKRLKIYKEIFEAVQ